MAHGPGKYDAECTKIQQETQAEGVLLIVIKGNKGSGFSVAAQLEVLAAIPAILRETIVQIENDMTPPRSRPN